MTYEKKICVKLGCSCEDDWERRESPRQGESAQCSEHGDTYICNIFDGNPIFRLTNKDKIDNETEAYIEAQTRDAIFLGVREEENNEDIWNYYWFARSIIYLTKDEVRIPEGIWWKREKKMSKKDPREPSTHTQTSFASE